jgi:hypothetical protein
MALYTSSVYMSCLPLHDITRRGLRWPGAGPTPRTNHRAEDRCNARIFIVFKLQYKSLAKNNFQNFFVVELNSFLNLLPSELLIAQNIS